jgi:uncharacterized membrane protein YgdD (TMEM256/DUF423 family)
LSAAPARFERTRRGLAAAGALFSASAIALGAVVAHSQALDVRERLAPALTYLLAHGIALAVLAPRARSAWSLASLLMLVLGTLLFCGSVLGGRLLGWPGALAPTGGTLMILAWIVHAIGALRGAPLGNTSRDA